MNKALKRAISIALMLAVMCTLSGCDEQETSLPRGAAVNDILTFTNNASDKPVIRIGMQYYAPDSSFIDTLEAKFPDYVFVLDYTAAAGTGQEDRLLHLLGQGEPFDMVVSGRMYFVRSDADYYTDLSAESFLNNYLLTSLNRISVDGKLYFLPGVTSMAGLAYNTNMFAEHGWPLPTNIEEFFALCEVIKEAGIMPLTNCLKYSNQINRMYGTMLYDKLFTSDEDILWHMNVQENKATFSEHMRPFYELAKRFCDAGINTLADFSASLTKQRQQFWAGEYAMMFADTLLYSYAASEGAPFEIGFIPFPTENSENSGYCVTPNYYMAIPKRLEQDPERLKLVKEIFAYLSTPEGQRSMLSGNYNISNVKGVDISENPAFEYIREAYERGNLYPQIEYLATDIPIVGLMQSSIRTLFEGGSVDDALKLMDESFSQAYSEGIPDEVFEVVAKAEEPFTMLETSYYLADAFKKASGADIGMMINRGYFRSNLTYFEQGDITADMRGFAMKGVSGGDWLTTYSLTGAQIIELLEHPIVNGAEIDALIASSGLKLEYAPWNERGSRVVKIALADGKALENDKLYTVAAWTGAIDAKYITETIRVHDALGTIEDIVLEALKRDKTIKPDIKDRLTLIWPKVETK